MMRKSVETQKKITYDTIETATSISKVTLSRMASQRGYNTSMSNIEKLCNYFNCSIDQLVTIVPENP